MGATIVIACAVAAVTYGAGAELLVADVSKLSPLQVAMLDAGYTALTTRAATLALTPDSGFEGFMKGMLSDETVRALATAMISAGLIAEAAPMLSDLGIDMSKTASFIDKLAVGVAEGSLRAIVDSAVNGNPLDENLKGALLSAAVGVIGAEAANVIGEAAQVGDLNKATQLIAHAALGCALGEASGGDCRSGAGGAVVGELTAWGYEEISGDELRADLEEIKSSSDLSAAQKNLLVHSKVAEWKSRGVNMAKLSSALAAGLTGNDANTAAMTAGNAVENNAFWIPVLLVVAAYTTYAGDGNPLDGLAVIGEGDDPLSQAIESGVTNTVEFSAAHFPEETMATLSVIEAIGDRVDATVTYLDKATGKHVSAQWNSLDPELRSQIKGSGKIASIFIPGTTVLKLAKLKRAPDLDVAKAQEIVNDVDVGNASNINTTTNLENAVDGIGDAAPNITGTVWDYVTATAENLPNTQIPATFKLKLGSGEYYVNSNATKHMGEYLKNSSNPINDQQLLHSFSAAIDNITSGDMQLGKVYNVDGWEIIISKRDSDLLPVVTHALYR